MGPAPSRDGDPPLPDPDPVQDDGAQDLIRPRPLPSYLTESEVSCEEAARLTEDGGGGSETSLCEPELPPPPDGGYGWVIVFASFMCNLIVDGIAYTFGIFLPQFVLYFGEGKGKVAWVGSLLSGMYLSVGPIVSALCNKFGCRAVCIAGSIIAATAFALSTLSSTVTMLMLVYGVIGGIGFGMIYLPAVVAVGYYFETKRSLATGIAVCGSGVGTFAFAPLATYLLENFGWRGANLILAGLILNCAVFGALMRPLVYPKSSSNVKPLLQRMAEEKRFQMERGSIAGSYFTVTKPDGTQERRMKMPLNIDPGVHSSFNLDQLVGSGLTPVPTMATLPTIPTLPTISEAKVQEQSESSSNDSSNSENNDAIKIKEKIIDADKQPREVRVLKAGGGILPRNSSSPAFTTYHQGLPKNGSVPSFDRIRKPSTGDRFKPSLAAIKASSRGSMSSNGDIKKNMHLRLSNSSMGGKNNNSEYGDGDMDSVYNSKMSISIQKEPSRMVRPLSRKDIFYSGSVVNLPEYQSQKSLTNYRNSVLSLPQSGAQSRRGDIEAPEQYDLCPCLVMPESFKSALASMMDMTLLKDPVFMMIGISNVFGFSGLYVPFVYLVDDAVLKGIDHTSASYLLSIIGITNTIGRVICGWVADFPWVNSLLLNNICLIISTVAVFCTPFCTTYGGYVCVAVFFGIAISGYISLTSIILVDLLGLDKLTNAFGLLILFRGAAAIIGSPLAGAVYDATKSYSASFFMAGAFFGIATVTSFVAPLLKSCGKSEAVLHNPALTPIDEDEEDMDDDDDDTPITMGQHPSNGGNVPQITHTAASPMNPDPPSKPGEDYKVGSNKNGTELKQLGEIKQIESVL